MYTKKLIQKNSDFKGVLKRGKHKVINYSSEASPSDRIQVYNDILEKLKK